MTGRQTERTGTAMVRSLRETESTALADALKFAEKQREWLSKIVPVDRLSAFMLDFELVLNVFINEIAPQRAPAETLAAYDDLGEDLRRARLSLERFSPVPPVHSLGDWDSPAKLAEHERNFRELFNARHELSDGIDKLIGVLGRIKIVIGSRVKSGRPSSDADGVALEIAKRWIQHIEHRPSFSEDSPLRKLISATRDHLKIASSDLDDKRIAKAVRNYLETE